MAYKIISDSTCNLSDEYIEQAGLKIISLEFIVDDQSYRAYTEGLASDYQKFYNMMREGKMIQTSLAPVTEVESALRSCFDDGFDVLYIGFDSAISASYDQASKRMEQIQAEEYPERKLRHVDSLAAALGHGLLVAEAVRLRDEGYSLDELADWLELNRLTFAHWFIVEDIEYLRRGGRLSKGSAFVGTLLSIKPLLHIDDIGRLIPIEKIRGRKKSIRGLFDRYATLAREPRSELPVYISHGDCLEEAEQLADMIRTECGATNFVINQLDLVIGAHSGPGTLAVFFLTDQPR